MQVIYFSARNASSAFAEYMQVIYFSARNASSAFAE